MVRVRLMILIVLLIGTLGFLGLNPKSSQGAGSDLTPEPRPTITPIPRPTLTTKSSGSNDSAGAQGNSQIVLQWESEVKTTTLSTIVQWQDTEGNLHDVDGWRGQFDQQRQVRWWVAPKDFRTGPFRWVIFSTSDDGNKTLWMSEPFYLPDSGQTLVVRVNTLALHLGQR